MSKFRQMVQGILDKSNLFKPKQQINISPEDKKIYEDKKWLIIQPSKIDNIWKYLPDLEDDFFTYGDVYKRGYPPKPYYIILNKKNPSEKYYLDNLLGIVGKVDYGKFEGGKWDDEYEEIPAHEVLKQHPELKDILRNNTKLNKIDHLNRSYLDKEYNNLYNKNELEYEDWLNGVKTDKYFTDLYSVPEEYRTFDICYICMKRLYNELGLHKKNSYWEYNYSQWESFNNMLKAVPSKFRKDIYDSIREEYEFKNWFRGKNYDQCLDIIKDHGKGLYYLPEKYKDYNMCLTAVKNYLDAMGAVPEEFKDYNMYLNYIKAAIDKGYRKNLGLIFDMNGVPKEYEKRIKQELGIKI